MCLAVLPDTLRGGCVQVNFKAGCVIPALPTSTNTEVKLRIVHDYAHGLPRVKNARANGRTQSGS